MNNRLVEIKWGVIFTIVMLLWMVFERLMGWHGERIDQHASMTLFFAVIAIALYVFALLDKRKRDLNGVMSWKQGFMSGVVVTLVVTVLSPLAQLITHYIITPEYFSNIIDYSVETGQMNREEAESYFSLSGYIIQAMIGALGMGIVTSAIVAVFTKKAPESIGD